MMKIESLAQHPHALPILAGWYHREWGLDAGLSMQQELDKLTTATSTNLPVILVAMEDGELLGAAQVKEYEMALYPQFRHWLGGVYVTSRHRGRGLARQLVVEAIAVAGTLRLDVLYLQTEDLTGGLYRELGWAPLLRTRSHGRDVLVMERRMPIPGSCASIRLPVPSR